MATDRCKRNHLRSTENTYITPKGAKQCRVCRQLSKSAYYAKNREREILYSKNRSRLTTFGVTENQWLTMLVLQDCKCAICTDELYGDKYTHVDHDHETDAVRGLLCHHCNTGIGLLRDSPDVLRAAISYLEGDSNSH